MVKLASFDTRYCIAASDDAPPRITACFPPNELLVIVGAGYHPGFSRCPARQHAPLNAYIEPVPVLNNGARISQLAALGVFFQGFEMRPEPSLRDDRGHYGAADHRGQQDRVLILIDDVVGEAEQRRDRSEGQARRHHQCCVHAFALVELEIARKR